MAICQSPPARAPESKVEAIFKHGVYEIATGAWRPGARLPSLREARIAFRVNHLTVLRAYRRLVALGLVRNVRRSGFFVSEGTEVGRLATWAGSSPTGKAPAATRCRRPARTTTGPPRRAVRFRAGAGDRA